ncbi:unnamed protein product, partial [Acanthoscelides obtectus]
RQQQSRWRDNKNIHLIYKDNFCLSFIDKNTNAAFALICILFLLYKNVNIKMSSQVTVLEHLKTYTGILTLTEEGMNILIVILSAVCGYTLKTYIICFIAFYALVTSAFFLLLYLSSVQKISETPWYWIECMNGLFLVILYGVSSSIVISGLSKGYIILGVTGYITTVLYALDMMDKYKLAIAPKPHYVWTTPNI